MQGVAHVDAVPQAFFGSVVGDVARVRRDTDGVKNVHEWGPDPLCDVGPAFLACNFGDLAAPGKALEIRERKRRRVRDHALYGESPVGEIVGLKALEQGVGRSDLVGEG